ncbi:MAG TPA: PhpK family radical SAM P-methyltransferase [Acidobacteriota bacterium]|nr:PhpK family radical SAM P-methyltransferase [Acidobacteriota bacterium]
MSNLDCVVLGYYEAPLDKSFETAEAMQKVSGGLRHLKANTLPFNGRRVRYPELINAAISRATGRPSRLHVANLPNLGAHYLASFLLRRNLAAEVVNFVNFDQERLEDLLAEKPRAVAITTTFYFESHPVRHLVELVREHSPETKIVVGGPHIFHVCSDYAPQAQDRLFAFMGADIYVFDSQGELTLSRVCSELGQPNPDLSTVPNLIYSHDNKTFHRTVRQPENNSLDENAVDWRVFNPDQLLPTVQTRTARSCAYKCAFCRYPVIAGDLNLTSLDVLRAELDYLKDIGVQQVLFIDDTFNIPRGRFKDLCRMMIRENYGFKWYSYFRCGNADDESFDLAAESGCTGVFLGIESGDQAILKAMNKGAYVHKYSYGLEKLRSKGIASYASFIIGFPGETEESARNTMEFIDSVRPTFYCLEAYFHDKKVPVAQRAEELGLQGQAYSWRHNSMDWRQAADLVEEGYHTITGSTICPLYSFDLWSLAYMTGLGLSRQQLTDFVRSASKILVRALSDEKVDAADHLDRLAQAFRGSDQVLSRLAS